MFGVTCKFIGSFFGLFSTQGRLGSLHCKQVMGGVPLKGIQGSF